MSEKLKAKLHQLADLVYEIMSDASEYPAKDAIREAVSTCLKAPTNEESKAASVAAVEVVKAAMTPKAKKAAPEPVNAPAPVKAPEPVITVQVLDTSLDEFLDEKPVVQRTITDLKTLLMGWVQADEKRKSFAITEFEKATGHGTLKGLTESEINEAYPKLEKHLAGLK